MDDIQFLARLRQVNPQLYRDIENQAFLTLADMGVLPPIHQPGEMIQYDYLITEEMMRILSGVDVIPSPRAMRMPSQLRNGNMIY